MIPAKLSPFQVQALSRLAAGQQITNADSELAATVQALARRGLVTLVKSSGRRWAATITAAGITAADSGRVPDTTSPRPRDNAIPKAASRPPGRPRRQPPEPRPQTNRSDLKAEVLKATRAAVRGRADEKGLLTIQGDAVVTMHVSKKQARRAIRLADSLITAAIEQGIELSLVPSPRTRERPDGARRIRLTYLGAVVTIKFVEETDRTRHAPTKDEVAQLRRSPRVRTREWDYCPNGRLRIELNQVLAEGSRYRFADGQTATLEGKIDDVVAEITSRGHQARDLAAESARLDDLYEQERLAAVEEATLRCVEDKRSRTAETLLTGWGRALQLRRFAQALSDGPAPNTAANWIDWLQAHADRLDPCLHPAQMPQLPSGAEPAELGEYLRDWQPGRPANWRPGQSQPRIQNSACQRAE